MPLYTIETTYRLPHFRQRTFEASTPEAACRLALEDEDWDGDRVEYETVGETYVTGVWMSPAANSGPAICVPDCFDEAVQRKAGMFGELLALLQDRLGRRICLVMSSKTGCHGHWPRSRVPMPFFPLSGEKCNEQTGQSFRRPLRRHLDGGQRTAESLLHGPWQRAAHRDTGWRLADPHRAVRRRLRTHRTRACPLRGDRLVYRGSG